MLLLGVLAYIFKECRFSCSCLSGQEYRVAGMGYQLQRILKLPIVGVDQALQCSEGLSADKDPGILI